MTPAFGFSVGDFISAVGEFIMAQICVFFCFILHLPREALLALVFHDQWFEFISVHQGRWLKHFLDLIRKVSKALQDTGGAAFKYQQVIIELQGLQRALEHLESLVPTEDNGRHVNAIRAMALTCRLPLQQFLTRTSKFETALGPFSTAKSLRSSGRKAQWAIQMDTEVQKLQASVAAKALSISLLLATHIS